MVATVKGQFFNRERVMSNLVLYGQIKSLVNIHDNPAFAAMDGIEKGLYVTEQLARAGRSVYSSMRGKGDAPYTVAEISDACEQFYRDYVEPIDLPINDLIEGIVDRNVPGFFEPGIQALADKLKAWQDKKAA
jgi:hypothetical protein